VNDLKIPGFDVVDEVEHGDGSEHERPEPRGRWLSGPVAVTLYAIGITGGVFALLVVLIGFAGDAFSAGVIGGCGGG
jgi:hypothetical protein